MQWDGGADGLCDAPLCRMPGPGVDHLLCSLSRLYKMYRTLSTVASESVGLYLEDKATFGLQLSSLSIQWVGMASVLWDLCMGIEPTAVVGCLRHYSQKHTSPSACGETFTLFWDEGRSSTGGHTDDTEPPVDVSCVWVCWQLVQLTHSFTNSISMRLLQNLVFPKALPLYQIILLKETIFCRRTWQVMQTIICNVWCFLSVQVEVIYCW